MSQYREFIGQVVRALPDKDDVTGVMQRWINNPSKLRDALRETLLGPLSGIFQLTIDYNRTIEELLQAGRYDWPNKNITEEHFPRLCISGKEERKYKLFHFSREISSDDAVREMSKAGFDPAGPHEMLVFGEEFPEIQRKFFIVGLGNPIWRSSNGIWYVVVLYSSGPNRNARNAFLHAWDSDWDSRSHFLARHR